jgi:hypothetical protein
MNAVFLSPAGTHLPAIDAAELSCSAEICGFNSCRICSTSFLKVAYGNARSAPNGVLYALSFSFNALRPKSAIRVARNEA